MKLNLSSFKVFVLLAVLSFSLFCALLFWRISVQEQQIHINLQERSEDVGTRVANNVLPVVYNLYKKSADRHFSEETASAILDSELKADFVKGIKVFGNFGHLFMGKYQTDQDGGFKSIIDNHNPDELINLNSVRVPVKQGAMTIGNIEVFYSSESHQKQLKIIIIRESTQIIILQILTLLMFYLMRRSSIARVSSEQSFKALKSAQDELVLSKQLLQEANLTLEDKVNSRTSELKKSNEKLLKAMEEAKAASKAKSLFLANMSHEIRTPMNGVIGLTELALRTELNDEQRDYLEKLKQSSDNLLHILNDILDLSKIEAGKFTIEKKAFSFSEMLNSVINIARPKAQEKGLKLNVVVEEPFPDYVVGDSVRCSQVLSNLVSNAVKFTETGSVTISVLRESRADKVHITVTDTGIGISDEQKDKLFSAFTQADDSTSRKYGGTGLGLVICQHLVSLMQGEIKLESEVGKGSRFDFTLHLPLEHGLVRTDQTVLGKEQVDDNKVQSYLSQKLMGKTVLLAEDVAVNRLIVQQLLTQAGMHVEFAVNGLEAVEMAKKKEFDIIIMDIQMPEMDGYQATRIIRTLPAYKDKPIVAMTANAMTDDKEMSKEAGMNSHLTKPIQFEQVVKELEGFF